MLSFLEFCIFKNCLRGDTVVIGIMQIIMTDKKQAVEKLLFCHHIFNVIRIISLYF